MWKFNRNLSLLHLWMKPKECRNNSLQKKNLVNFHLNIFVAMKRHWFDESWQRRKRRKNNEHCVNIRFTLHWICVHSMNGFDITKSFNGETVPPKKTFPNEFTWKTERAREMCVFFLSIFFRIPFQCFRICSVLLIIILNSFQTTHFRQQHIASKQIHQYSRGNRMVEIKKNGKLSSSYCVWFLHDNLVLAFCMKKKQTEFERDCYVFLFWFLRFQIFNRNFIQTKKNIQMALWFHELLLFDYFKKKKRFPFSFI